MQVSCKVSYSALIFLERQGVSLEAFFEKCDTPVELLKDPSCWLSLDKMESFLLQLCEFSGSCVENFYREVGQSNFELRAWGVLDSVLKMVESPKDIFLQPDRFLSYFLSPHPEIRVMSSDHKTMSFEMNITEEYPMVLAYLSGAVEGLPVYMGLPIASIESQGNTYKISWEDDQNSLFDEEEKRRRQFHPEIVQSVMDSLQDHQKNLDTKKLEQISKNSFSDENFEGIVSAEVEKRMNQWFSQKQEFDETLFKVKNDFYKLYDYFVRAQQLVTLISGTAKKASVKEAMRRVDWAHVQKEFPDMVEGACDSILSLKGAIQEMDIDVVPSPSKELFKAKTDLNVLIDSVVETLSMGDNPLKIDKHLLLDKKIPIEPASFSQAIQEVLDTSISQSRRGGELRIVTRPNGRKIEIEITDTGAGFAEDVLEKVFSDEGPEGLKNTRKVILEHKGNISISSKQGEGSTYLIELPMH